MLNISIKDSWEWQAAGKILLIEDWYEKGYQVERTLKYFQRIGLFEQAQAIVLGDFLAAPIGCTKEEQLQQAEYMDRVLQRFAQSCTIPVYQTIEFGHGTRCLPCVFE